jgi:hypothetical protein
MAAVTAGAGAVAANATPLVANDSLDFLPSWGTAVGSFLTNLIPAIIVLTVIFGIIGAVIFILTQLARRVGGGIGGHHRR